MHALRQMAGVAPRAMQPARQFDRNLALVLLDDMRSKLGHEPAKAGSRAGSVQRNNAMT
jgi:hypothetical protein